ncbi:MAG: hypothetical protein KDD45_17485, partial [Bdellovibrionales bacterium]|nr:hypothetical protein [Bdellovibrionales bacterium]
MNKKTIEIRNTITKLENPFPKDDLITSYKDFLKFRAELPFYQFNLNVLTSLIKLSNDTWDTKERISRISIIQLIKRYGFKEDVNVSYYRFLKVNKPSKELRISLFKLFKRCFEKNTPLTNKQSLEAKRICNSMLF